MTNDKRVVNGDALRIRQAVHNLLHETSQGLTPTEIAQQVDAPKAKVMTALNFYHRYGIVHKTEKQKKARTGRMEPVWKYYAWD